MLAELKRKFGKLPARVDAVRFKLRRYIDASALPTPPLHFGNYHLPQEWGMLANDNIGNCVWAGAAHEHIDWAYAAGGMVQFNDQAVISDYSAATGFDPKDPDNTDNGSDMEEAAKYRRKIGIVDAAGNRHQIEAYAALKPGDPEELALATYLFGATGVGLQYPAIADEQLDAGQPWDIKPGQKSKGLAGHYVCCIGRNTKGNLLVVTWGRLHAMTPAFYHRYCDEAIAYLAPEMFDNRLITPEGFSIDKLRKDLKAL